MRIVAVSQAYLPEPTAAFLADLSEHWLDCGHRVSVLTATPWHDHSSRVEVVSTPHGEYGRGSLLSRATSQVAFGGGAALHFARWREPQADVVLFVGSDWLGSVTPHRVARRRIHWVHDVYPDALAALMNPGRLSQALTRPARVVLDRAWNTSDRVVTLSPGMARRLAGRIERTRLGILPLWALPMWTPTHHRGLAWRRKRGIDEAAVVVLHHGNLGLAYDFEPLLEAARRLGKRSDIVFALVGNGGQRRKLEAAIAAGRLSNVRVFDSVSANDLPDSLSMGDLHLIPLRREWDGISFPSKLIAALALARPVVVTGAPDGEVASAVRSARCGIAVETGEQLAAAIETLAGEPATVADMGEHASLSCRRDFNRKASLAAWDALISDATQPRTGSVDCEE